MYRQQDLLEAESFVRRIVTEQLDGEPSCHPKVFDCPVCQHETLSTSRSIRVEGKPQSVRYCFGCGNIFSKNISWRKVKEEK